MEHKQQILFRKLLKKNDFIKSDTSSNKKLMEFTKETKHNTVIVYTYEIVEVYFFGAKVEDAEVLTISKFKTLYKKYTGENFLTE